MAWIAFLIAAAKIIAVAAVSTALSYGIQALIGTDEGDMGDKDDPTYGWGGIVTTSRLGAPKPINYGRIRSGGHNIMTYYDIKYQPSLQDISNFYIANSVDAQIPITLKGLFNFRLDINVCYAVCMFPVSNLQVSFTVPAWGSAYACLFIWSADNPSPLSINNWERQWIGPRAYERQAFLDFSGKTGISMIGIVTTFEMDWGEVAVNGSVMPINMPYIGLQQTTDQYANILLALGEGQIEDVDDIEINGQKLRRYVGTTISVKKGSNESGFQTWDKFMPHWFTTLKFESVDENTFKWYGTEANNAGDVVFPDGSAYRVSEGYFNLGSGQYATIYWDPYESSKIQVTTSLLEWVRVSQRENVTWMGCAYRLPFGMDDFFNTRCFVFVANQTTGLHNAVGQLPNLGPIAGFRDVFNTYEWDRKLYYNKSILNSAHMYPWAPVESTDQEPIVDDSVAVYETEEEVNAIAIGLKCPKGLYHMSKKGKMKSNDTYFCVWWRRLNPSGVPPHGMWHPLCNFGALVSFPLMYVYQYMTGESISSYNSFDLREFFKFTITEHTASTVYRELRIDFPKGELIDRLLYPTTSLFNIPEPGGRGKFQIIVTKTCPDPSEASDQNELWVDYIKEIRYDDIQYIDTALLGLQIKATDQLSGSIPSVTAVVHGMQVKMFRSVDTDGNPVFSTSKYGTNYQWSNNPSYCLYDIITNERYGLGKYIASTSIDHESFLDAAKYCDEPVIDGFEYSTGYLRMTNGSAKVTGMFNTTHFEDALFKPLECFAKNLSIKLDGEDESYGIDSFVDTFYNPILAGVNTQEFYLDREYEGVSGIKVNYIMNNKRSTFNASLDAQASAMDVISSICGTFNCIPFWSAGALKLKIEKAVDTDEDGNPIPVQIFNMGSIIRNDDMSSTFSLQFVPLKDLPNYIEITYLDEDDNWEQHAIIKYDPSMTDDPSIELRKLSLQAIGITRENQAKRLAQYLSNFYKYSNKIVSFKVDSEAIACEPGDIIEVQHDMPNWHYGGRVVSSTTDTVIVDELLTLPTSETWFIRVQHYDATSKETKFQQRTVSDITDKTITVSAVWDYLPVEHDIYVYVKDQDTTDYLKTHNLFRISTIQREEDGTFSITANEYNDNIYDESLHPPNITAEFVPDDSSYDDGEDDIPLDVTDLILTQSLDKEGFTVSYAIPNDHIWHRADIYMKLEDQEYTLYTSTSSSNSTFISAEAGNTYYIKVISYSAKGIASESPPEASIYLEHSRPADVTGLKLKDYPDGTTEFSSTSFELEWDDMSNTAIGETAEDDDGNLTSSTQHEYKYHILLEYLDFNPLLVGPIFKKYEELNHSDTTFSKTVAYPLKVGRRFRFSVWARSISSGMESLNPAVLEFSNSGPDMSTVQPTISISKNIMGPIWTIDWSNFSEPEDLTYYKIYVDHTSAVRTGALRVPIDIVLPGKKSIRYGLLDYILHGDWISDWGDWKLGDDVFFVVVPYDIFGAGTESKWVSRYSSEEEDTEPPDIDVVPDAPVIGNIVFGNYGGMFDGYVCDALVWFTVTDNQHVDYCEIYALAGSVKTGIQTVTVSPGYTYYAATFYKLTTDTDYTFYARSHNSAGWSAYGSKVINTSHLNTLPSTPISLVLTSGLGMIFLEWSVSSNDYIDHYEIYTSIEDDILTATLIGTTDTNQRMFSYSIASGVGMYYWIKAISLYGVASAISTSVFGSARFIEGIDLTTGLLKPEFIDQSMNTWTTDIVFSSSDHDKVSWTAGYISFSNGKTYTISAVTDATIALNSSLFIYLDTGVSETAFQTSALVSAFIGEGRTLICRAVYNSDTTSKAMINPGVVQGLFTAANIAANSIVSDKIAANAITAAKIAANTITANEIAAGTITATEIYGTTLSAISADIGTVSAGILQDDPTSPNFIINLDTATITINTGYLTVSSANGIRIQSGGDLTIYDGGDIVINDGGDLIFGDYCIFQQYDATSMFIKPYSDTAKALYIGDVGSSRWKYINLYAHEGYLNLNAASCIMYLSTSSEAGSQIYITLPDSAGGTTKTQYKLYYDGGFVKASAV